MPRRDIVAIGASAGGVNALRQLTSKLPASFAAAVLVTVHLAADYPSELDHILTRSGSLPARFAPGRREDRERKHLSCAGGAASFADRR